MSNDIDRLRTVYKAKRIRNPNDNRYSLSNPSYLFSVQQRQRFTVKLLRRYYGKPLEFSKILEIGCGSGGVLGEYHQLGATPQYLTGIDLLFDRLEEARRQLPLAGLGNVDGQNLPFPGESFDIVMQYTAFSSILDLYIKKNMAVEMLRVLKCDGIIVWYDFWLNPTNPQTKGIRPGEIKNLFSDCRFDFQKITLAPPLARKIVPISWKVATFLESLGFLNSHYLAIIQK